MAADETLQDLRTRVAGSAFHTGLGMQVEAASEGSVTLSIEARPDQLNLGGSVHGGVLASLADTAMGLAVRTAIEPGRRHVTIQLAVQYLAAAQPGRRVTAEGTVVRAGSQIAFAEAELRQGARTVARAQGAFSVTPER
jgi:acyl-CoA thioesterase